MIQKIPSELLNHIEINLDFIDHVHFLITCKQFYKKYPRPNDYTDSMRQIALDYSSSLDEEYIKTFNYLIANEGPINKRNREGIEKFFHEKNINKLTTIEIYGKKYNENNLFQFQNIDIKEAIPLYGKEVFELLYKQDNRHNFNSFNQASNYSILHVAVRDEDPKTIKALLSLSPSLVNRNITSKNNLTIINLFSLYPNIDVMNLLFTDSEFDINAKYKYGNTLLHQAVICNNSDLIKVLLVHTKIDINPTCDHGYTPLHYATENNKMDIIHLLLEKKADCNVQNELSRTPYHCAKNPEIAALLAQHTSSWNKYKKNIFDFIEGISTFIGNVVTFIGAVSFIGIVTVTVIICFFDKPYVSINFINKCLLIIANETVH
jgi:ankyrin repeat protein